MIGTRISLSRGNAIGVLGTVIAFYLVLAAADAPNLLLSFLMYLVSWGCLLFFPHGLTHYIVGSLVGVRFRYYFLGRSSISKLKIPFAGSVASRIPILTLKIERASLARVRRGSRAVMFASGALVSMILPFFSAIASLGRIPTPLSMILFIISAANVLFDAYYSPRVGDIHRATSHPE